jgi:peptidase E
MSKPRQIFALGNNPFNQDPKNTRLYRYFLELTNKSKPNVCLIPTASGDSISQVDAFTKCFTPLNVELSNLSLFRGNFDQDKLEDFILSQDLIYVSGGNTRNMLVLWKEWGLDKMIRKAYEQGTIMAGGSAGSLCWFESGVTDSIPGPLTAMKCLAYLKGSNCPHYDGEVNRRPRYHALIESGELIPGLANEDGVALHFVNESLKEVIACYPNKHAYQVDIRDGKANEIALPARLV